MLHNSIEKLYYSYPGCYFLARLLKNEAVSKGQNGHAEFISASLKPLILRKADSETSSE